MAKGEMDLKKAFKFHKRDVGKVIKYIPLNSVGGVKPNVYSGKVVEVEGSECARVFNARLKGIFEVHVDQVIH
jgi:hypothetical protein